MRGREGKVKSERATSCNHQRQANLELFPILIQQFFVGAVIQNRLSIFAQRDSFGDGPLGLAIGHLDVVVGIVLLGEQIPRQGIVWLEQANFLA